MPDNRTLALVKLLNDGDAATVRAVVEALSAAGPAAIEALRDAAQSDDALLRVRARPLLQKLLAEQAMDTLAALVAQPDPDLERGLVLLAQTEHPELELSAVAGDLDDVAHTARAAMEGAEPGEMQVERFLEALFSIERFRGNTDAYYDPRNSMIDHVLRERTGIPVSLAAMAMLVGRRCGLQLDGIGMPAHFLVQITAGGEKYIINTFSGGQVMSREACRGLLAGMEPAFKDEFLAVVSDRALLERMFRNLLQIHSNEGDAERAARMERLLAIMSN